MAKTADMTNPAIVLESFKSKDSNSFDSSKISRSITDIRNAGKRMDARLHATAFAIMDRGTCHGDVSLLPALLTAMPRSARREHMIAWFHAYSNIRIRFDKKADVYVAGILKSTAKDYAEPRLADAWAKPFYTPEEQAVDPKVFDDARFASLVASIIRKAKDAAGLSPDTLAAIEDLKVINAKLTPAKQEA